MSRIGKKPITIPDKVEVSISDKEITVKGPKGQLQQRLHPLVQVSQADGVISVAVENEDNKTERSLWGLYGSLIKNMVDGVTEGYTKKLELNGIGFKVSLAGKNLNLSLGFSHEVVFPVPDDVTIEVEKNIITVSGIDKQRVGETAAQIRALRKPEPYKGKGIKYVGEVIRRKAGKAAGKGD